MFAMEVSMLPEGLDYVASIVVKVQLTKSLSANCLLKLGQKSIRKATIRYILLVAGVLKKNATHQQCSDYERRILLFANQVAKKSFNHEALNWEAFYAFCLRSASYIRDTHECPLVDDEPVFLAKMRRFFETLTDEANKIS